MIFKRFKPNKPVDTDCGAFGPKRARRLPSIGVKRGYVMGVLVALSTLNQLDRQLMTVLLEPIRHEFSLSDVQLGLLSGMTFAIVYAGLSIPAAIWAVHHNRRNLIAATALVWGSTTILFGGALTFWQLLLGRIGTGIGEAGAMPASHSIISDLYQPHERGGAMAAWSAGINLGVFIAFLFGGVIGARYGWRTAFFAAGLCTVAAALLTRLTVAEPRRNLDARSAALRTAPSLSLLRAAFAAMWSDVVPRHVVAGATITSVVGYGALAWAPSYLFRAHGLTVAQAGIYLAVVIGLGGAAANYGFGRLSDRVGRHRIWWSLGIVGAAYIAAKPFSLVFYLSEDTSLALAAFVLPAMTGLLYLGPSIAVLHNRIPEALRPGASAIFLLLTNLVGLGLGPLLVGMMSQWLYAGTDNPLGYALATLQIAGLWGGLHFIIAGRRLADGRDSTGSRQPVSRLNIPQ